MIGITVITMTGMSKKTARTGVIWKNGTGLMLSTTGNITERRGAIGIGGTVIQTAIKPRGDLADSAHRYERIAKKRAGSRREPALSFAVCLLRCDCRDRLQAEGNDPVADHFTRDDQLDATILLTAFGGIVGRDGPSLTEARSGGRRFRDALLR